MTTEIVKVNPSEYGIEESKANELVGNLPQIISEREVLATQFDEVVKMDIESPLTAKRAKELRVLIKNNRTKGIEVWHKTTKDYFLKGGQFVDAIKRKEIAVNERMEESLEEIENYAAKKEAERKESLRVSRVVELQTYAEFVPMGISLGELTEEEYLKIFNGAKLQLQAKIEAEQKAEAERIAKEKAEAEERERIKIENEKLKAEAEVKEKQLAEERAKAEAERKAIEEKARKEKAAADAKLKAEKEANEKLQAEIRAKAEAEEKAKRQAEAKAQEEMKAKELAEKKAKAAPDKAKLNDFAKMLDELPLPELKGEEANKVLTDAKILIAKVSNFIREKSSII